MTHRRGRPEAAADPPAGRLVVSRRHRGDPACHRQPGHPVDTNVAFGHAPAGSCASSIATIPSTPSRTAHEAPCCARLSVSRLACRVGPIALTVCTVSVAPHQSGSAAGARPRHRPRRLRGPPAALHHSASAAGSAHGAVPAPSCPSPAAAAVLQPLAADGVGAGRKRHVAAAVAAALPDREADQLQAVQDAVVEEISRRRSCRRAWTNHSEECGPPCGHLAFGGDQCSRRAAIAAPASDGAASGS